MHVLLPPPTEIPAKELWPTWRHYIQHPLDYLTEMTRIYGDAVDIRFGPAHFYLMTHPTAAYEVLVTHAAHFRSDPRAQRIMQRHAGSSVLATDGDTWHHQRQLMEPAFQAQRMEGYMATMTDVMYAMVEHWHPGLEYDIYQEMVELTFSGLARILFGYTIQPQADHLRAALTLLESSVDSMGLFYPLPRWLPIPRHRDQQSHATFAGVVTPIIHDRRLYGQDTGDVLSMLLLARTEDGSMLDDQQVYDEIMTILLAGHMPLASLLTWTCTMLAQHPACAQKLETEIDQIVGKGTVTAAALAPLHYTEMVLLETLRLYPANWSIGRQAVTHTQIGGYPIFKGTSIFLSPAIMHHDARWFPDPACFLPERFDPHQESEIPSQAYIPFGAGPRICLGTRFAMTAAKLILATLVQRYRFVLIDGQDLTPVPHTTLVPARGIRMRILQR